MGDYFDACVQEYYNAVDYAAEQAYKERKRNESLPASNRTYYYQKLRDIPVDHLHQYKGWE